MKKNIVFTGGGTAGHVFPGLAVVEELRKKTGCSIYWIGSRTGIEKKLIKKAGIPYFGIPSGKWRRYLSVSNLTDIFKIIAGFFYAIAVLIKIKPCLLFSKGGYVSVPPVIAGFFLGIPTITHECDYVPGMATMINAHFVEKILISFKESKKYFNTNLRKKVVCTGNPIRSSILKGDPVKGKHIIGCPPNRKLVLILGGSLGSRIINEAVLKILKNLTKHYFIVHQMGENNFIERKLDNYYSASFFTRELPHLIAASDLIISRSGANILWEIAAMGKPSILIPLSKTGSRGDQIQNAEIFFSRGASQILSEDNKLSERLLKIVPQLIDNNKKMEDMQKNALALSNISAASLIAEMIYTEY